VGGSCPDVVISKFHRNLFQGCRRHGGGRLMLQLLTGTRPTVQAVINCTNVRRQGEGRGLLVGTGELYWSCRRVFRLASCHACQLFTACRSVLDCVECIVINKTHVATWRIFAARAKPAVLTCQQHESSTLLSQSQLNTSHLSPH